MSSLFRPLEDVIVIFCSLPVPRSFAETLTMPFASMSKVTSICGTPRGAGGMSDQVESSQRPVVARHRTLALKNVNLHGSLTVRSRRERFALPRGNRRVALDQLREDATQGFDTERQRRDVE